MATKLCDLAVKVGTYTKNGEEKGRYENIGAMMQMDDGREFMFIKRSFNPAGVPFKEGSESIIVSMFSASDKDQKPISEHSEAKGNAFQKQDEEDDIPF